MSREQKVSTQSHGKTLTKQNLTKPNKIVTQKMKSYAARQAAQARAASTKVTHDGTVDDLLFTASMSTAAAAVLQSLTVGQPGTTWRMS